MGSHLIGAVVVSYNPSREILRNVAILSGQVGHVVVVDNTPSTNAQSVIDELEQRGGCTVIRNKKNLGIATALNIGIRAAISKGAVWIVTFDQDSHIGDGFIDAMLATYREAMLHSKVGILCPRYKDARLGVFLPMRRAANGDISGCFTSGAMTHADTFRSMGLMEEALFIDYVDHEYCLRLRCAGYKIVECPEAILQHSLGRITSRVLLGKTALLTNHSPRRHYYISRNRLTMIERYLFKDKEWALREIKGLLMDSVKVVLLEKQKLSKACYILRGLFDSLFGRMGLRVSL
ncbi:MAG TPA: glycosyltransferase family 2 protein [Acidobacteriaceae bacterium]|nr:glycosyltransferase family 2 protein [Acidobacteriaceae bacterium]